MIDQADRQLRHWAASVLDTGDASLVSLAAPGASTGELGISLYLMECAAAPPPRGQRRPPLQVSLRYLVTTWAKDPEQAHRLFGELVFAAMENPDFEVDLTPLDAGTWSALGTRPQPSFVLSMPLRRERPEPDTRYVRVPLVVRAAPLTTLEGTVLGPADVPITGARVEVPGLNLVARSDSRGRFKLAGVPATGETVKLLVRAKGHEMTAEIAHPTAGSDPLVIRFNELPGSQEE